MKACSGKGIGKIIDKEVPNSHITNFGGDNASSSVMLAAKIQSEKAEQSGAIRRGEFVMARYSGA